MKTEASSKPIACKLTSPELQRRKAEVLATLKTKVKQTEEIENGYRYLFADAEGITNELISFIKSEKLCCDFLAFTISFIDAEIWLAITGPDGTKDFITQELEFGLI